MSELSWSDFLETFRFLFEEKGFKKVEEDLWNWEHRSILAESPEFRIRFLENKDDLYVEIAPHAEPDNWVRLERFRDFLTHVARVDKQDALALAAFLNSKYHRIARALSGEEYLSRTKPAYERFLWGQSKQILTDRPPPDPPRFSRW